MSFGATRMVVGTHPGGDVKILTLLEASELVYPQARAVKPSEGVPGKKAVSYKSNFIKKYIVGKKPDPNGYTWADQALPNADEGGAATETIGDEASTQTEDKDSGSGMDVDAPAAHTVAEPLSLYTILLPEMIFNRPANIFHEFMSSVKTLEEFVEWWLKGKTPYNKVRNQTARKKINEPALIKINEDGDCLYACIWMAAYMSKRGDCSLLNPKEVSEAVGFSTATAPALRLLFKNYILSRFGAPLSVCTSTLPIYEATAAELRQEMPDFANVNAYDLIDSKYSPGTHHYGGNTELAILTLLSQGKIAICIEKASVAGRTFIRYNEKEKKVEYHESWNRKFHYVFVKLVNENHFDFVAWDPSLFSGH